MLVAEAAPAERAGYSWSQLTTTSALSSPVGSALTCVVTSAVVAMEAYSPRVTVELRSVVDVYPELVEIIQRRKF